MDLYRFHLDKMSRKNVDYRSASQVSVRDGAHVNRETLECQRYFVNESL